MSLKFAIVLTVFVSGLHCCSIEEDVQGNWADDYGELAIDDTTMGNTGMMNTCLDKDGNTYLMKNDYMTLCLRLTTDGNQLKGESLKVFKKGMSEDDIMATWKAQCRNAGAMASREMTRAQ